MRSAPRPLRARSLGHTVWVLLALSGGAACGGPEQPSPSDAMDLEDLSADVASDDGGRLLAEPVGDGSVAPEVAEHDADVKEEVVSSPELLWSLGTCEPTEVVANPNNLVAGTQCTRYEVTCEGLDTIELTLLIAHPDEGVEPKGVVTFSSGTGGTTLYNANIAKALVDQGFITVRRQWSFDWETGPGGMRRSSCRFATLLAWLRGQEWTQGLPLCATGNSGGATEIAYALTTWSAGELLDLAVPTGGPPMGRVDLGCLGGDEWEAACKAIVPDDACPDEQLGCTYNSGAQSLIDSAYEGTPCADGGAEAEAMLAADSVVNLEDDYHYPQTFVHLIEGRQDCSEAAPLGMLYGQAITSEKLITWVDAPHGVFQSQEGAAAIRDSILERCIFRH